jgi:EmrB/QacA subfamily drug resistance transporter
VLAVSVLGSGIAALDATVVNIALPAIGRDFGTGVAALQWVMNGYTLTLAAFLLIGGSLGDRFGRRKVYLIGTAWFALASAACGFAPDVVFLIITRVLQGAGAALLVPGSLAILEASFRPADRARAIGAWSGLGGIAVAAGPLVGGYLISAASWRWIFFINIPVAVMVIVLSVRHVPESRDPDASSTTDYLGAAAMVVFLSGITFAFIEAPALGWSSPVVLTMASLGVIGLAVFLAWERRAASPMLPLSVFAQRQFAAVNAVSFIVYAALTGATFLLPVVLQVVSGYSPLGSGLALLPLTIIMLVLSGRSGQLAARIGPRLQLSAGPLVVGAGLALLVLVPAGSSYVLYVLPAVVVFGLGIAITVAPLGARRACGHRVGGQQRRGPVRRLAGRRHTARPGRHHRLRLPGPGRPRRGIPDRGAHLGSALCRRRPARRRHDHQPGTRASRRRYIRAVPALRPRCAATGS